MECFRALYQRSHCGTILSRMIRWINTEAQLGKTDLDTYFFYVQLQFFNFISASNHMTTEEDFLIQDQYLCYSKYEVQVCNRSTLNLGYFLDMAEIRVLLFRFTGENATETIDGKRANFKLISKSVGDLNVTIAAKQRSYEPVRFYSMKRTNTDINVSKTEAFKIDLSTAVTRTLLKPKRNNSLFVIFRTRFQKKPRPIIVMVVSWERVIVPLSRRPAPPSPDLSWNLCIQICLDPSKFLLQVDLVM